MFFLPTSRNRISFWSTAHRLLPPTLLLKKNFVQWKKKKKCLGIHLCSSPVPYWTHSDMVGLSSGVMMSYLFAFPYCSWGLTARILEWVAISSSGGPRFVRTLHYDLSVLGGPAQYGSKLQWVTQAPLPRQGCDPWRGYGSSPSPMAEWYRGTILLRMTLRSNFHYL